MYQKLNQSLAPSISSSSKPTSTSSFPQHPPFFPRYGSRTTTQKSSATMATRQRMNVVALLSCLFLLYLYTHRTAPTQHQPQSGGPPPGDDDVEMVVASRSGDNVTWLEDSRYLPAWKKNIYRVDDPTARLTVPVNKGREAMVYLTYASPVPFCARPLLT